MSGKSQVTTLTFYSGRGSIENFLEKQARYVLLLPAVILLALLFVYPIIYTIDLSVHQVNLLNVARGGWPFVGLDNFYDALTNSDFIHALWVAVFFGGTSLILEVVLGMILALTFNSAFVGKNFLMTICLLPMMMTPIAVGIFWRLLLNSQWGIVNYFIGLIGIPRLAWLGDPTLAQVSVIGVTFWWQVSFSFLVFLGGLTALPVEVFEAASIDGASRWQSFRYITLPLMIPVISVVAVIRLIDAFRAFDVVYALTDGGPGNATEVIALHLYDTAFRHQNFSEAAALALLLSVLMLFLTALLLRALRARYSRVDGTERSAAL